jgi:hypothetical protein
VCDAAYLCQVEQLERATLAQVALLPHVDEETRKQIPTVDEVRAEFDTWLLSDPEPVEVVDSDTRTLRRLLGVGK